MSQLLLQVAIVVAFGALCFGCSYLTAFIVTRNKWRDEIIKRGVAYYDWQTVNGNGRAAERSEILKIRPPLPAAGLSEDVGLTCSAYDAA